MKKHGSIKELKPGELIEMDVKLMRIGDMLHICSQTEVSMNEHMIDHMRYEIKANLGYRQETRKYGNYFDFVASRTMKLYDSLSERFENEVPHMTSLIFLINCLAYQYRYEYRRLDGLEEKCGDKVQKHLETFDIDSLQIDFTKFADYQKNFVFALREVLERLFEIIFDLKENEQHLLGELCGGAHQLLMLATLFAHESDLEMTEYNKNHSQVYRDLLTLTSEFFDKFTVADRPTPIKVSKNKSNSSGEIPKELLEMLLEGVKSGKVKASAISVDKDGSFKSGALNLDSVVDMLKKR